LLNLSKMDPESTVLCVDDSEFMKKCDFVPTKLEAQHGMVSIVCLSKGINSKNKLAMVTLASNVVITPLSRDLMGMLDKLERLEACGDLQFVTGLKIAHLALKHPPGEQEKDQRIRIVCFIGSPIGCDTEDLVTLASKFKEEKVNVDIVNFSVDEINSQKLNIFMETLNGGMENPDSHLHTMTSLDIPYDDLLSSPIMQRDVGSLPRLDFEVELEYDSEDSPPFVTTPHTSPRTRIPPKQETEATQQSDGGLGLQASDSAPGSSTTAPTSEDEGLLNALRMSMNISHGDPVSSNTP